MGGDAVKNSAGVFICGDFFGAADSSSIASPNNYGAGNIHPSARGITRVLSFFPPAAWKPVLLPAVGMWGRKWRVNRQACLTSLCHPGNFGLMPSGEKEDRRYREGFSSEVNEAEAMGGRGGSGGERACNTKSAFSSS
jgi:hypothetical protein